VEGLCHPLSPGIVRVFPPGRDITSRDEPPNSKCGSWLRDRARAGMAVGSGSVEVTRRARVFRITVNAGPHSSRYATSSIAKLDRVAPAVPSGAAITHWIPRSTSTSIRSSHMVYRIPNPRTPRDVFGSSPRALGCMSASSGRDVVSTDSSGLAKKSDGFDVECRASKRPNASRPGRPTQTRCAP